MKNIVERTLSFLERLQHLYLETRDLEAVASCLDEDVSWISVAQSYGHGKLNVLNRIREEYLVIPEPLHILQSNYNISVHTDQVVEAVGDLVLQRQMKGTRISDLYLRVTALCVIKNQTILLKQIHASQPGCGEGASGGDRVLQFLLEEKSRILRNRARDLNILTNNLPGGVICCENSREMKMLYSSDGFFKLFGITRQDMEAKFDNEFSRMFDPVQFHSVRQNINEQLARNCSYQAEYCVYHMDGHKMYLYDHGQLVIREDGRQVLYCILMDVTEKREAIEELHLSLERYQIIADQTTDIVFEWEVDKDTLMFSQNWYKKFGYIPTQEDISRSLLSDGRIHPDDLETVSELITSVKEKGEYLEREFRIQTENENYLWCRIRVTPQRDKSGRVVKAIGVIIDVKSEKKSRF